MQILANQGKVISILLIVGIPEIHWFGTEAGYNLLVMELLGSNLGILFGMCGKRFSLKTTIMIADQIVNTITILDLSYRVHAHHVSHS